MSESTRIKNSEAASINSNEIKAKPEPQMQEVIDNLRQEIKELVER